MVSGIDSSRPVGKSQPSYGKIRSSVPAMARRGIGTVAAQVSRCVCYIVPALGAAAAKGAPAVQSNLYDMMAPSENPVR